MDGNLFSTVFTFLLCSLKDIEVNVSFADCLSWCRVSTNSIVVSAWRKPNKYTVSINISKMEPILSFQSFGVSLVYWKFLFGCIFKVRISLSISFLMYAFINRFLLWKHITVLFWLQKHGNRCYTEKVKDLNFCLASKKWWYTGFSSIFFWRMFVGYPLIPMAGSATFTSASLDQKVNILSICIRKARFPK